MLSLLTQSTLQTPINPPNTQGWAAETKAQPSASEKAWQGVSSNAWTVTSTLSSPIISVTQGKFSLPCPLQPF